MRHKTLVLRRTAFALAVFVLSAGSLSAEKSADLGMELTAAGSWEQDASLIDRLDLRLRGFGFTSRAQMIDKRPAWENIEAGNTAFSGGLYHSTGSRFLYGIQDEAGLPARIRNPWARTVPFVESHKPSVRDLKTEPSSTREAETYLYLGSPQLGPFRGFASAVLDHEWIPAYSWGMAAQLAGKTSLSMEGFFTERTLPPRKASAWFSETPPLPERDFRIYGANVNFNAPLIGFASDWAYSEAFGYGADIYGNAALRLGNKPWRLSLAADGTGERYTGPDGTAAGAGFRNALRLERFGARNGLFRTAVSLRSKGFGEAFERSSAALYYRLPAAPGGKGLFLRPTRFSLTLNRDGSDPDAVLDSAEGTAGFAAGPVSSVFQGTLAGTGGGPGAFPNPAGGYGFNSFKVSGEFSCPVTIFLLKARLGWTVPADKDPIWGVNFSASVRGKSGRFTVKLASEDFPREWIWTLSWRFHYEKTGTGGRRKTETPLPPQSTGNSGK
ncbi:MAG: hypothetical protein LBO80_00055 [Treponema sp.]|jgi:hypothetical protein|nr:hypothetical protein [Treponema sp.]